MARGPWGAELADHALMGHFTEGKLNRNVQKKGSILREVAESSEGENLWIRKRPLEGSF
jgi:hypothetical protein